MRKLSPVGTFEYARGSSCCAAAAPAASDAANAAERAIALSGLNARLLHDALVALGVGLDAREEFLRAHADRLAARALDEALLHIGKLEGFANFGVDAIDDRLWRALRREEAHPDGGVEIRDAGVARRGPGRIQRRLFRGGDADHLAAARLDVRQRARRRHHAEMHVARRDRRGRRSATLVRD